MKNLKHGVTSESFRKISFFLFILIFSCCLSAQTHTFPTFNPGSITSANTTIPVISMPVSGLTASYLVFEIQADFVGTGPSPSFSGSIQVEVTDGSSLIYLPEVGPTSGGAGNSNSTTLIYSGNLATTYFGGNL